MKGTTELFSIDHILTFVTGAVVPAIIAYTEHRRRKKAEKELEDARLRSEAPALIVRTITLAAGGPARAQHGAGIQMYNPHEPLPQDIKAGTWITLTLANNRRPVWNVTDDWQEGSGIVTRNGMIPAQDFEAAQVIYPFDPAKKGKTERITIRFVTEQGFKQRQTYELVHGTGIFRLVDPE